MNKVALVLAGFLLLAGFAAAQPPSCSLCGPLMDCRMVCSTGGGPITCLQFGSCNRDPDGDGIPWERDNCPVAANANQADCDGDGIGNACDLNGTFVPSGKRIACSSDKDQHVGFVTYEMRYKQRYVDTSACHSADRWNVTTLSANCFGICNDLDANGCGSVCVNNATYQCNFSLCSPIGQDSCPADGIQ